ncbi:MAG: DEAD/DEAH box helicase family protein, partial [Clostridia bacterium]|nr:DEAD/DEAH box helicase family protein [Clostridia bacterium]
MDLAEIKGFGAKRIEALKSAGINSPADLISYFPKKYVDTAHLTDIKNVQDGSEVVILASTSVTPKVARIRKNLSIVKVGFTYDNSKVYCIWYNQPFMAKNIVVNRYYYISGKIKKNKSTYEIISPTLYPFETTVRGVIPVYKPIGKINSKLIAEAVSTALNGVKIQSFIPENISQKYTLMDINDAFRAIHFPRTMAMANEGKRAIMVEKLAYKFTAFDLIKRKTAKVKAHEYQNGEVVLLSAIKTLPYELTGAQSRALGQIITKMKSPDRLNCLLEGDVGCGKTIVAFLAMYYCALSGYQSALMAPTEVLAKQHYD